MSLQQIVDEIKQLSGDELEKLRLELENSQLTLLAEKTARRWAGQTFDFSEYPKFAELWSPFDELDAAKDMEIHLDNGSLDLERKNLRDLPVKPEQPVIYMDLREYLPVPAQPTPEELELLRP